MLAKRIPFVLLFLYFGLTIVYCGTKATPESLRKVLHRQRRDTSASSEELVDVEEIFALFFNKGWQLDKHAVLASLIESTSDTETVVTLVATQDVHNEDGTANRVISLNLVIPLRPSGAENKLPDMDLEDDEDDTDKDDDGQWLPYSVIRDLKEVLSPFEVFRVPSSVAYEQYDKEGNQTNLFVLTDDELYYNTDNFTVFNKTYYNADPKVAQYYVDRVKSAIQTNHVGYLKYDENGVLLDSQLIPTLQGSVTKFSEATAEILSEAPLIVSKVTAQYAKPKVAKQLALAFDAAFPEYKWRTVVNVGDSYITQDVSVSVQFDNIGFNEDTQDVYTIYGNKITNVTA